MVLLSAEDFKNRKEEEVNEFDQKAIKRRESFEQFTKTEDSIKYTLVISTKGKVTKPTSKNLKAIDEMNKKDN